MVLFIDIVRKFSFKHFSQYIHEIAKAVVKNFSDNIPEVVDDDLRGLAALSLERIGHADNLTTGSIQTKSQVCKTIYEGGQNELVLWLYGNEINSPEWKDKSGWSGVIEKSILFDGTNDFIDCGNDSSLWSQSLTKFSFSFWIYPTAAWDGNERNIVNHLGSSANGFRSLLPSSGNNTIQFRIRNSVPTTFTATSNTLVPNQWNFVVCVYDNSLGSANLKIYVNAVLGTTTANVTDAINASAILSLADSTTDFKGNMKDFRWWTTKALSSTEVSGLYKLSPMPTPDYWLKMTEGSGNPIDTISGTKVGTLTNGANWEVVDRSKTISRIGNPCVVKTTQNFIGRKLVGYFDGLTDGGKIADHVDLKVQTNTIGISISGWFYIVNDALQSGKFRVIYVKKDDSSNHIIIFIDPVSQKVVFELNKATSTIKKEVSSAYTLNTWVFLAFVWDYATNVVTIYKNGTSQTVNNWSGTSPTLPGNTDANLLYNNATPISLNGAFYNFKFWRNRKLTSTEIGNENTNKFSISNVTSAELPIMGFCTIST